jgi:hypothetical protein
MITPEILPNNGYGITNQLPRLQEPYLPALPPEKSFPTPGESFTPASDNPSLVGAPPRPATTQMQPPAPRSAAEEAADVLRTRMGKAPTLVTPENAATPAASSAPENAPVANGDADANAGSEASSREPEARPLTKEELKRVEKAREEERKAEERRKKEDAKAAKQAQKDAEKAMKEAEKAAKEAEKAAKRSKTQQ